MVKLYRYRGSSLDYYNHIFVGTFVGNFRFFKIESAHDTYLGTECVYEIFDE